ERVWRDRAVRRCRRAGPARIAQRSQAVPPHGRVRTLHGARSRGWAHILSCRSSFQRRLRAQGIPAQVERAADHRARNGTAARRIAGRRFFDEPKHQVPGVKFSLAAGIIGELAAANQEIIDNDLLLNVLAFATIYIIILVTYRSFMAGFYLLFPLALANAAINAYMGAHDIGININTLPVVTVGVGFGIDYSIYIVSRIIEELAAGHDLQGSTYTALVTSGKAVAFTALTLVASVLFWYWSSIRFDAEMGLLLAVWMFVSMLGAMTILPVLIATFDPAFIHREKERVIASRRPDLKGRTLAASS